MSNPFIFPFSGCGRADDRQPRVRAVAQREGHQRDHLRRDDLRRVLPRRPGLLSGRLGRTAHDRDRGQVRQSGQLVDIGCTEGQL